MLLYHYPPRSSGALLAGTLPLRYCSAKFASRTPFWALPVPGHVAGLITVEVQAAQVGEAEVVRRGVEFVGISGSGRKRFRPNRKKNQHTSWWKRLHFSGFTGISSVDCKRRRCNRHDGGKDRCGLILGLRRPTSPGLHVRN